MVLQGVRRGAVEDFFRPGCVIHRAVDHQDKLVGLQRRLIFQYAVLGDAQAVKAGAKRAHAADHDGAFQRRDDPTDERSRHQKRS